MVDNFQVRTDLALEVRESLEASDEDIRGIRVEEYQLEEEDIHVTKVMIDTKNAAKILGKPVGCYVTIEAPMMTEPDDNNHPEISEVIAKELIELLPERQAEKSILIVGLGNRAVTADSLGPCVTDNLLITRHIVKQYGNAAYNKDKMNLISSLEPGVMAKTGMETAEIIKGVVEETRPDVLLVVDALAARSTKRLNKTIQITNTGIQPGSGVNNHRHELTKNTLNVPVIAIGVPTVVDAATIVSDAFTRYHEGDDIQYLERYESFYRHAFSELRDMYMTGKDIDAVIKRVSFTISEGINAALELEE